MFTPFTMRDNDFWRRYIVHGAYSFHYVVCLDIFSDSSFVCRNSFFSILVLALVSFAFNLQLVNVVTMLVQAVLNFFNWHLQFMFKSSDAYMVGVNCGDGFHDKFSKYTSIFELCWMSRKSSFLGSGLYPGNSPTGVMVWTGMREKAFMTPNMTHGMFSRPIEMQGSVFLVGLGILLFLGSALILGGSFFEDFFFFISFLLMAFCGGMGVFYVCFLLPLR